MATIGHGVDIRTSRIPDRGLGLFATRYFRRDEIITEYDGRYIRHCNARKIPWFRTVYPLRLVLSGLYEPLEGYGGASYANDPRSLHHEQSESPNAEFLVRECYSREEVKPNTCEEDLRLLDQVLEERNQLLQDFKDFKRSFGRRIFLKALVDIQINNEILVDYGKHYPFQCK